MGRYQTDEDVSAAEEIANADPEEQAPEAPPEEEGTPEQGGEGQEGEVEEPAEAPEGEDAEPPQEVTYPVKVNGQELQVPVSELARGYMRNADYTRKTQMLAQERGQLTEATELLRALDRNPHETISLLAQHFGVSDLSATNGNGYEEPTVEARRLQELEAWRQSEITRQREVAVDAELHRLHGEYGDFDEEALFGYALEHQVAHLETALRSLTWEQTRAGRQVDKSRVAAQGGGQSHSATVRPRTPPTEIRTFRDAYAAAKAELQPGS